MPLIFSDHAREQIKRRNISHAHIKKAVYESDEILPSFRGRKLRRIQIASKILEVITRTEGSHITVITAYFLER